MSVAHRFVPEQLLALGIYTTRGSRDNALREFLHGVVRRKEAHSAMACSALRASSNARPGLLRATQRFLNPTPETMVRRVEEMCRGDLDMCREVIILLEKSTKDDERRARVLKEQVESFRVRLGSAPTAAAECLAKIK